MWPVFSSSSLSWKKNTWHTRTLNTNCRNTRYGAPLFASINYIRATRNPRAHHLLVLQKNTQSTRSQSEKVSANILGQSQHSTSTFKIRRACADSAIHSSSSFRARARTWKEATIEQRVSPRAATFWGRLRRRWGDGGGPVVRGGVIGGGAGKDYIKKTLYISTSPITTTTATIKNFWFIKSIIRFLLHYDTIIIVVIIKLDWMSASRNK